VVLPAAPLGLESNTTQFALTVRPYVLRDWLVDACKMMIQNGFCHFVCFSGHLGPRQLTAIEDAASLVRKIARKQRVKNLFFQISSPFPTLISASSALISKQDVIRSPFWPDPEEHGGEKDTSKALVLMKQFVLPNYQELPRIDREASRWKRNWLRRTGALSGYWGDPAKANLETGEQELLGKLDAIFPKMKAVWEGTNPNRFFRTWYSILAPNKSFFKAWLLVVCVSIVLGAWAYLTYFGLHLE
jgi:creatinine amidohydrolase/Fe(II)-dependent formamide hydrolase-like protein